LRAAPEVLDHRDPEVARSIVALQRASYAVEARLVGYPGIPALRETEEDVRSSDERFLAVEDDGVPVGVLSYSREGGTVEICRLVVSPDHFRQGIAGVLLAAIERAEPDARRLVVSTAVANRPAVALYEKHGYRKTETHALPDGLRIIRLLKHAT